MTPREARTERRAAERKAKKAEMRRTRQSAIEFDERPLEEEFSSELMAEANAMRDRIHRRALDPSIDPEGPSAAPGFVPQNTRASINRQNAQHSTGPRSSTGKLASSRNSLKHGLASGQVIISGEDPSAFEALLVSLLDEHQPGGATEELLVNQMAQSYWLAQRALRLQNECFTDEGVDDKRLSLYMRYHATHDRAFHKALGTLMKLKKEQARGFVSQSARRAAANHGFVSQQAHESLKSGPEPTAAPSEPDFVRQKELSEAA